MKRFANLAVWVIALLPMVVAGIVLTGDAPDSKESILNSLGRLAGIGGLGFMLISAALSSRVPGFDRAFGGLTKLWHTHHLLGAGALLLLLVHPVLLALSRGAHVPDAVTLLFPNWADWQTWSGWLALAFVLAFLGMSFSFFGPPKYQRWKTVHRLAAPAILLALAHSLALNRTIPFPYDAVLWGILAFLAAAALAYRWLFSHSHLLGTGGRFPYRVEDVFQVSPGVVEIKLQPISTDLEYEAGQFVYMTCYDKRLESGLGEEHPFTLSSSPTESGLRITIKNLGDASRALQSLTRGSDVRIEGPYGAFFDTTFERSAKELWIAGGIGITPFLSRARYLNSLGSKVDIQLVYCVQDEARALFHEELTSLTKSLPGFSFKMHYFFAEGPLNRDFLTDWCPDVPQRRVYLCGPTPLIDLAKSISADLGVAKRSISTEEFNLL